jgi:hypothetical protein
MLSVETNLRPQNLKTRRFRFVPEHSELSVCVADDSRRLSLKGMHMLLDELVHHHHRPVPLFSYLQQKTKKQIELADAMRLLTPNFSGFPVDLSLKVPNSSSTCELS